MSALATVAPSPDALAAARRVLAEPEFSWDRACDLAARNWVLPAVAGNVVRHDDLGPVPGTGAAAQLRLGATAARVGIATVTRHLQPVWAGWDAAGVRWALTKGAALIASIYPPDARLLNDVDVLVAPEDYERARGVLIDHGFAPAIGAHREEEWRAIKEQVPFSNAASVGAAATTVDLHAQLYGPTKRFAFDTHALLSRRRPAPFGPTPVSVLEAPDLLLHLATQVLNDQLLTTLLRLADLSVLLARVDPDECDRRAAASGSTTALAFARAGVVRVFPQQARIATGSGAVERRAASVAAVLIARGWPWAERVESLPESYRQAAADLIEDGPGGALAAGLRRGFDYRRDRRRSGASAVHSAAGGLRMAVRGVAALVNLSWATRRGVGRDPDCST